MQKRLLDRMSLDAFRVFETAARHMNFSAAARELLVTQAAVSRRIQKLESDLQIPLFHRDGRKLELTAKGDALYRRVQATLDFLSEGLEEVIQDSPPGGVVVAASGAIAHLWLGRRLRSYVLANPDETVRLITTDTRSELTADSNDLTLLYSTGAHPHWSLSLVAEEALIPVAAPSYLARAVPHLVPAEMTAADIAALTLFDYGRMNAYWLSLIDWFEWQGIDPATIRPKVVFPNYPMAVDAALNGEGIMLGSREILVDYLRAGALVELSGQLLITGYGYYVGLPKGRTSTPEALRLWQWLLSAEKS
ncbi:LysR family transcriptional regulator [Chachezhania sediminis]|uniref:LysR family transcriptional regulator n=1 Tax=Chachezhania sediminis TaxID=2599291 RepID=UPI00131AA39B|nr:LysR family transcriptional regulator [Chachezhania sediminis]